MHGDEPFPIASSTSARLDVAAIVAVLSSS
jgi:hypothetical protein